MTSSIRMPRRKPIYTGKPVRMGNEKLAESPHNHDVTRPTSVPKEGIIARDPMPPTKK
jgi:hypothetical protein